MTSREAIYAALFAKFSSIAGFTTISRRLQHWSDTPLSMQPALFMAQRGETVATVPGLNQVWSLSVDLYLYANTGADKSASPGSILNPLLDAVVAALAPDKITNKCTLGGIVEHAWIEGRIETDEGVLGDQGVAIVPLIIKAV